jgi:hypothetical protein
MKLKIITHTEIFDLEAAFNKWSSETDGEVRDVVFTQTFDGHGTCHFTAWIVYEEQAAEMRASEPAARKGPLMGRKK